jgi:hypothetical protein
MNKQLPVASSPKPTTGQLYDRALTVRSVRSALKWLRGYYEFSVENRTEGGSVFPTVNLPNSTLAKAKGK